MTFGTPNRRQLLKGGLITASAAVLAPLADAAPALAATGDCPASSQAFEFNGQIHYFDRSESDELLHLWNSSAGNWGQFTEGGTVHGAPTGLYWPAANQAHVFATDGTGDLGHWWQNPGDQHFGHLPMEETGIYTDPSATVYQNRLYVFFELDNSMWYLAQSAGGGWLRYYPNKGRGELLGPPTVVSFNGQLHVFGLASQDRISHWWGTASAGSWDHEFLPAPATGRPAVVYAHNQLHVFARSGDVPDASSYGTLKHWWQNAGARGWAPPEDLGGSYTGGPWLVGDPAATVWNGQIHVYIRSDSQNYFTLDWWYDSPWTHKQSLGAVDGNPSAGVYMRNGRLENHVFCRTGGTDDLTHRWYTTDWFAERIYTTIHS